VFLDSPVQPVTVNGGMSMPSWFDLDEIPVTAETKDDEKGLLQAVDQVGNAIERLQTDHGIPAENVVVGGFSQGAAVAGLVGAMWTKPVGGVLMLSGWVPLRARFKDMSKHTGIKVFHGHGEADDKVLFQLGSDSSKLLADTGFDVQFSSYPGVQHSTCPTEMRHIRAWLEPIVNR